MTGLEPHPIFRLPTQEEAREMGQERFGQVIQERARRMVLQDSQKFEYGFEPEIWHLVDDLLVDGNKVILDLSRIGKLSADGKTAPLEVDVPKEIRGAPEIWIGGSNRSTKTWYSIKKIVKILTGTAQARTWSFADTGPISVARQQPVFWEFLPAAEKRRAELGGGKFKQGVGTSISYRQATGFAGETFVLMNRSQNWFKNYAQDIENVEGDKLHAVLFDELRDVKLLKTIRGRMGDFGGIIIVCFTSIDDLYSPVINEYDKGSTTILEVDAELLPKKDEDGLLTGQFEKVPRVKVAGPGSDGDQRANIVYFHITDNPFYGYEAALEGWRKTGRVPIFGKERFYRLYRSAIRSKILSRVYGILISGNKQMFPEFNEAVHVCRPDQIPREGTDYHLVDPHDGRNWAMMWPRIDPRGRWFIRREWPSYGADNRSATAYIPGVGDPGPWTLAGSSRGTGAKPREDGDPGPAQNPFGFGLTRYKQEILRCENNKEQGAENVQRSTSNIERLISKAARDPLIEKENRRQTPSPQSSPEQGRGGPERIAERYMDSRYGAAPTTLKEGQTTLLMQMSEIGMEFLAASGKDIVEGIDLIHELLDYDRDVPIGKWSPRLARINEPLLKVSSECPNTIYALKNWTNLDKQHGACKEWIDLLRYAVLANLQYVGKTAYSWSTGGAY